MTATRSRTVAVARSIHRALIILVPRDVRASYTFDMLATFADAAADARTRGRFAVLRLLCRETVDLAFARRANRPDGIPVPPSHRGAHASTGGREWAKTHAWRQALRSLTRRPAYFAAALATLGFGAGITTAVFSLVDTVLIKPLPYPDSDQLVTVYESSPSAREKTSLIAPGRLEEWNRMNRTFVAISGMYSENVTDTSGNEPERLEGRRVAPRFFAVYRMPPLAGRFFTPEEELANGPGAAVISERVWERRFNRSGKAIGHGLIIGGRTYTVVGVIPRTFINPAVDVWLPAQVSARLLQIREARFMGGVGRLKPGVSVDAGARDLVSVQDALAREFPGTDSGWSAEVASLKEGRVRTARRGLVLVFGAVASLWIIAVANIAGLTLVQLQRRTRELAIRAALGASRLGAIGTVIREGVIIAMLGGIAGALLAWWLVSMMPAVLARTPRINELVLDWRAVAFAGGISLLAACLFGLIPALAGTRAHLNRAILEGSRGVAGGRHRVQKLLVVSQVAVSVLLVGSATLLLRSYYNLTHVETGFDPSSVVTFHVGARWDEDRLRIGQMQQQLLARLQELPHVQGAGMTNFLPTTGATLRYQVRVDGLSGPNPDQSMTVGSRTINGGYLRAMRAPLLAGEFCPEAIVDFNTQRSPRKAMINRRFVDAYASNQDLLGRVLRLTQGNVPFTIVGVIGNLAEDGQGTSPVPYVYGCDPPGSWPDPEYVARTSDAGAFATDLRRIVRELDPARAVFGLRPLQDVLDMALDQPRLDATLLGVFAAAAVTLAAIGLYSLFMLVVSERSREMAVRLAIGASPSEVMRLVMAGAGRLLLGGIVLGVALTAVADRLLRGILFGVSPLDVRALTAAALTLAVVAALAASVPAIRAARIAPTEALKGD